MFLFSAHLKWTRDIAPAIGVQILSAPCHFARSVSLSPLGLTIVPTFFCGANASLGLGKGFVVRWLRKQIGVKLKISLLQGFSGLLFS
jgi:hypothetical protein